MLSCRALIAKYYFALLSYDCFPEFSKRVRRFVYHPFGILCLTAGLAILCGLFLHSQGFVLAAGLLVVLSLGSVWPWLSLQSLTGTLVFSRARTVEGESLAVELTLRNFLPCATFGLNVCEGFGNAADHTIASIAAAPGRKQIVCRWFFQPNYRGVYPLNQPKLTTGFPFGLWVNRRPLNVVAPLIVWPRTFPVGPIPMLLRGQHLEGSVSRRNVGTQGDAIGVRPYRRGDSPRRVHWAQSAKHDRLIVCEMQSTSRPVIQLVLDADSSVHVGEGADSSREWAIRVAASFAKGWLEVGAQVGLVWGKEAIAPQSGQTQTQRLLDALAAIPGTCEHSLAETLASPRCRLFRAGLQVIITTDLAQVQANPTQAGAEQRWVVLASTGFSEKEQPVPCSSQPKPWLLLTSRSLIPTMLLAGWREARHGS